MPHTLKDVLPVTARVNKRDHLEIGGCDTVDLATQFGTPLFVFCEETFHRRAQEFKDAFPGVKIYYAAKAFLSKAMCQLVMQEGINLDVASGGELHVALVSGFPPDRMIMHGNNKEDSDILRAVEAGIGLIAIDNLEEVGRVGAAAEDLAKPQNVVLRVTPGVEAHTHDYIQTGQEDSKFGLSIESGLAMKAVEGILKEDSLNLRGVHAHIGSNIFSYDPFAKTIEILFDFIADVRSRFGLQIEEVNLGGGVGIPYLSGDYPVQLELLSQLVSKTVKEQADAYGLNPPALSFEPGRFLMGNAMLTLYTVGVIKEVPGVRTYVAVDGGMSDNIRPALYQARYAATLANKARHDSTKVVSIAGMHCESGDILIRDVALPESIHRGDLLAIPATGAYGYSMSSNYNKQPRAAVVLVSGGSSQIIVRRESFDDLLRLDESL